MAQNLKQLKRTLQEVVSLLQWNAASQTRNNQPFLDISSLTRVRSAINKLIELKLFENATSQLRNSVIYTTAADNITVQPAEGNEVLRIMNNLKDIVTNFYTTLSAVTPDENPNSVNIKLPDLTGFDQLSEYAKDFHQALTQILYNPQINGECKIVSVENGSIWLNVYVGSVAALTFLGGLAWAAAVVFKKIQEGRILQQQVESLKVKNESLKDIKDANEKQLAILVQSEAENLNNEYFQGNDNENIERLKNSVKLLAELLQKGAEIHPALQAPESVSNLFPDTKNLISLESKIKKLAAPQESEG